MVRIPRPIGHQYGELGEICRFALDVARELALFIAGVLRAERRTRGTRRHRRALSPYRQALLVPRWFRDATPVHRLARDHQVSVATAYRSNAGPSTTPTSSSTAL